MALRWESKRPAEVRTYQIDWSTFLGVDTIASHTLAAVGVTVDNGAGQGVVDAGLKSITVKLSGGTSGTLAKITNTIVTAGGETEAEKIVLFVSDFAEPVSLELAKAQCRVRDDSEDALLCNYVRAAREFVENYTGHILVRRPITTTFYGFTSYLELPHRPVVADQIEIFYIDADGVEQEQTAFAVETKHPFRIHKPYGDSWPSIRENTGVEVTYVAGYDEGEAPQGLIQPMLIYIEGMRSGRGEVSAATQRTVQWLCDQFRDQVV